ncbi:MAG TPA: glutamyl-tRNA reductase [Bryobacteraceae bacterium]|jgi:glutamyl-tRNA reductase|nr:glutamyl-tRNA reductase [Bryobacteraceae bacterium]
MRLALAGINHRTAPVELREKLAFRLDEIPAALMHLRKSGAKEALILSTCNRVEITAALEEGVSTEALLDPVVSGRSGITLDLIRPHLYLFEADAAIRHLFRVAASLDSMIVGEPQILGQLKQAYAQAREQGTIGNCLDAVLTRAFSVAKRIRTETEIGQSAVSVSYAAVELAREIFGSLHKKKVLIVGAGKMSEGAARHLIRAGADEIFVTNRTPERARDLSELFQGKVLPYESFAAHLGEMDIVITSSGATGYVIQPDMIRRAIEARKNQPMFLIDIAVPRNVNPGVNRIEHAFLYDMDDLQRLAERNMRTRREVAEQAESIVAEEVARLESRLRARELAPTIVSLQEQFEAIRQEVMGRYRPKLGTLTPEQEQALEQLTRAIINKVAHGPISEMRRDAETDLSAVKTEGELITAVRRIFRLGNG